jgi:SAM-dependent methyltransferase
MFLVTSKDTEAVLDALSPEFLENERFETHLLIIDDSPPEEPLRIAEKFAERPVSKNLIVLRNRVSQGYGGNRKLGLRYALLHAFDVVVLIEPDTPDPVYRLIDFVVPILSGDTDVVLGSVKSDQILTNLRNRLVGIKLKGRPTGFRSYRVASLTEVPFESNSDQIDFDTDLLIQLSGIGKRMVEIPLPAPSCHPRRPRVRFTLYWLLARSQQWGIWYHPKFDYARENEHYKPKLDFSSSHRFALDRVASGNSVLDLGCGPGFMAVELKKRAARVVSVDRYITDQTRENSEKVIEGDVETLDFTFAESRIDEVLVLDIIEHLRSPELFLSRLRESLCGHQPKVILTTGNIAFFVMRLSLLFGKFNYGKRGILDMDHTRLYTFRSLRRVLEMNGFTVIEEKGIPVPFPMVFGRRWLSRFCLGVNQFLIRISKSFFSYQIGVVATIRPTLEFLLEEAQRSRAELLKRQKESTF